MSVKNNPRIVYNSSLFLNPSFEGEGELDEIPLSWSKVGDGNDLSTFLKKFRAREVEIGNQFNGESEVLGTDTLVIMEQDISILLADLTIGDVIILGGWVKSDGVGTAKIRVSTRTGADAVIETATDTKVFAGAEDYNFIIAELAITTLASYDHIKVELEHTSATTIKMNWDDVLFGRELAFPITSGLPGNATINNIRQVQPSPINNKSLGGLNESLRFGRNWWAFDLVLSNVRQAFRDSLFEFWKDSRQGGNHRFAFFLDKDSFLLKEYHYPYLVVTNEEWLEDLLPGLVRYDITLSIETTVPFELA